jgi:hypothetical protein
MDRNTSFWNRFYLDNILEYVYICRNDRREIQEFNTARRSSLKQPINPGKWLDV